MLISVIVPTSDRKELLELCLNGLIKQTYKNFEVIIINDSKNRINIEQDLMNQLNKSIFPNKLKVNDFKEQKGAAFARNFALKISQGGIIAFTDDDAIPTPYWLKNIVSYFKSHPTVTAVNGKIEPVSLKKSNERIRQAYYDYRNNIYSNGQYDNYLRSKYKINGSGKNLADWLSLGNCALQKNKIDYTKNLFDNSMKLDHGHKLAKKLMIDKKIVTYSNKIIVRHNHYRSFSRLLITKIRNGTNCYLIDQFNGISFRERFAESLAYLKFVFKNNNLYFVDKFTELIYSTAFLISYLLKKNSGYMVKYKNYGS